MTFQTSVAQRECVSLQIERHFGDVTWQIVGTACQERLVNGRVVLAGPDQRLGFGLYLEEDTGGPGSVDLADDGPVEPQPFAGRVLLLRHRADEERHLCGVFEVIDNRAVLFLAPSQFGLRCVQIMVALIAKTHHLENSTGMRII